MRFEMRLRQSLICDICDQSIDAEKVDDTTVMRILFGEVPYAVCFCGMEVAEPWGQAYVEYRKRWRARHRELRQKYEDKQ